LNWTNCLTIRATTHRGPQRAVRIHLKTDGDAEARSLDEVMPHGAEPCVTTFRNALAAVLEVVRHYRAGERAEKGILPAVRRLRRSAGGAPF